VSLALLCLAAAMTLWPGTTARARLPALLPVRGRSALARLRWETAIGPVPIGVFAALSVLLASTPVVALLAGMCSVLAARAWLAGRRSRRESAELAALADACGALGAELRAGRSAGRAVEAAARACDDEGVAARLTRAVRDPRPAVRQSGGNASPGLERLSAAVLLSERTGCSLAEVVSAVEDDLRARIRGQQELRSVTAAPRAGATLLAALPLLGLAMGAGVGADPWGVLTTTPTGQVLLVGGVALEVTGVAWTGRLVRRAVR
jgi:tight adherence protein B